MILFQTTPVLTNDAPFKQLQKIHLDSYDEEETI